MHISGKKSLKTKNSIDWGFNIQNIIFIYIQIFKNFSGLKILKPYLYPSWIKLSLGYYFNERHPNEK